MEHVQDYNLWKKVKKYMEAKMVIHLFVPRNILYRMDSDLTILLALVGYKRMQEEYMVYLER